MNKIQYAVWKKETGDAGGKAKNDAFDIALKNGFVPSYRPSEKRIVRVIQQYMSMKKFDSAESVFIQYPAIDYHVFPQFLKHVNSEQNSIALIHDLRSIQGSGTEENIDEIAILNHFKHVIAHNNHMACYLKENGCTANIISLELFDYLHDLGKTVKRPRGDGSIAFAGNLKKSIFLKELGSLKSLFLLYGVKGEEDYSKIANVEYMGCLPSDEIVNNLEGDYGLVWDGDSIDSCSGKHGQYLKYNNPHKLSLYIAAGKPIISWKQAAIAEFIEMNQIGITVDSLSDLENCDLQTKYDVYQQNVMRIKQKIAKGEYLKNALDICDRGL